MKKIQFKKPDISMQDILNGNIFTSGWVKRQYMLFLEIVVMIIVYIFMGYQSQSRQARLVEMNKQIQEAHYEYLSVSAELSEMTRQSAIAKRLQDAGSNVKESNLPATRIE